MIGAFPCSRALLGRVRLAMLLVPLVAAGSSLTSASQLLASGHADEAIEALQQETRNSPTDAEAHNLLCRAYYMIGEWDRGIPECERARNIDPRKSSYELWLGRIYGEKADRAGALTAAGLAGKVRTSFERAVQLDPNNWEARSDLGEFYLEAPSIVGGGKDKARLQAAALMSLNPGIGHWVLARIADKSKDHAAAEREYRASIEATHSGARAWLDYAIFLRHANRLEEMDQALQHLDSAPVDLREALMDGAGLLLQTRRDQALAVRLIRRYISDGPVEAGPAFKAHDILGELLEHQGDKAGAAEHFRAALALYRGDKRAQEGLRRVQS